jgi:hypothetical protein
MIPPTDYRSKEITQNKSRLIADYFKIVNNWPELRIFFFLRRPRGNSRGKTKCFWTRLPSSTSPKCPDDKIGKSLVLF